MAKRTMRAKRRLRALGGGLLLLALGLPAGGGCAAKEEPDFPVYAPTEPYLREQARIQKRAKALRAYRGSERVRNVIRFRRQTLAAWEPIYARVKAAEEARRANKERER